MPALDGAEHLGQGGQGVEDRRAAARMDGGDRFGDGRPVVGRAGGRLDGGAERRHDHPVALAQLGGEALRRRLHHVHAPVQALAAVDEQRERGRDVLQLHQVERLGHAVLGQREVVLAEPRHVAAVLVLDGGLDQHRRHAGLLEDLQRRQGHRVADDRRPGSGSTSTRISRRLVGVLVGPFDRVGRPVVVGADLARRRRRSAPAARRARPASATWATTRITPGTPVRPSGEVMRTVVLSARLGASTTAAERHGGRGGGDDAVDCVIGECVRATPGRRGSSSRRRRCSRSSVSRRGSPR